MASFEDLPPLEPPFAFLSAGLLVIFWLFMRVRILRSRIALREEGEAPPHAPKWMHSLAASERTMPVLGVVALLIVGAIAVLAVV